MIQQLFGRTLSLKRGVFRSIVDHQVAINRYIQEHDDSKPFQWTKPEDNILAKTEHIAMLKGYRHP